MVGIVPEGGQSAHAERKEMFRSVRVAAVNFVPWKWHRDWNADRLEEFCAAAAKQRVELIVAPEGILEGYVVNQARRSRQARHAMLEIAEPIDGPYVRRFRSLAKKLRTCLVFGMAELKDRNDIYNTAVFVDHRGRICGAYNKMQLPEGYSFDRPGKTVRAIDTPVGRCGMLICKDRWNPKIARALVLDGARFLCIPTYGNKKRVQDRTVLRRARENGVPIVQSNVGRNLIISKGEIVALDGCANVVTVGEIDIPAAPSARNARAMEREYLAERPAMMKRDLRASREQMAKAPEPFTYDGNPPKPRRRDIRVRDHTGE